MTKRMNTVAVMGLGALWAGTLVVSGATLAGGGSPIATSLGTLGVLAGVTFVAAGQFVFMVVVADRMFPRVERRVRASGEAFVAAALLLGLLTVGGLVLSGGMG